MEELEEANRWGCSVVYKDKGETRREIIWTRAQWEAMKVYSRVKVVTPPPAPAKAQPSLF